MRIIKYIGWSLAWLAALVCAAWAFGALYFDFPTASALAAILFVLLLLAAVVFVRGKAAEACDYFCRMRACRSVVANTKAQQ
jgi:hypothetical protein